MRKLHSLLTFALLVVCAHVASAKLVLGEHKTTFSNGDRVIIEGGKNQNATEWVPTSYWYGVENANKSVLLSSHGGTLPLEDKTFIYELQDANESFEYNGKTYTGWHFYCPGINKYLVADGAYYIFKYNRARAQVFYIVPPAELAVMRSGGTVEDYINTQKNNGAFETMEGSFDVVVRRKVDGEGTGKDGYDYYALNHNLSSGRPGNAQYTGCSCWYRFYEGSDVVDAAAELESLLAQVEPIVKNAKEGTTNGCIADMSAFNALKAAFENATADGVDAEKVYPVLKEALDAFRSFGNNGFVPLTDGFYRIISGYDPFFDEGGVYKGMGVNKSRDNALYSARFEQDDDLYIWKVTATDNPNRYIIRNVNMMEYINNPTRDKDGYVLTSPTEVTCAVTMSSYCNTKYIVGNNACINYRWVDTGADRDSRLNHKAESSINPASDPALWRFEKVEDISWDELEASMEQKTRNVEFDELLATARQKYSIALGYTVPSYPEEGIISYEPAEGEELTKEYGSAGTWTGGTVKSNYKQASEGSYGALCDAKWWNTSGRDDIGEDKNNGGYFHSIWSTATAGYHYLQFDLEEDIENVSFFFARRRNEGTDRRPAVIDVEVCNDTTGGGVWHKVGTIYANYFISGDEGDLDNGKHVQGSDDVLTDAVPLYGKYKHIRAIMKKVMNRSNKNDETLGTYSEQPSDKRFFTCSEFNIISANLDPSCQLMALKSQPEMAAVINHFEEVMVKATANASPTQADMDELQKAYDDFLAVFPDPTPLKTLIAETQEYMDNMYVGGVPGTYASQDELDTKLMPVLKAIDEAQADIDDMTLYTIKQVDDHIAAITAARQALIDGARPIDFTKWVRLYLTREYWVKNPDKKPENWPDNVAMYAPEESESETTQVTFGLFNSDKAKDFEWRFVPVKDGYFLQSRSTGKFIGSGRIYESSRDWDPGLSSVPAVFNVEPIGGGSFAIEGLNMDGSEPTLHEGHKYLHGAFAAEKVTYWFQNHLGSNSGWEFEVQNEDAFDEAAKDEMMNSATITKHLVPNRLYTGCYPTDITLAPEDETMVVSAYQVVGKNADESVVYLQKMEETDGMISIPAGTPFLYEIGEEGTSFTDYTYTEGEEANAPMLVYYDFYPTLDVEENEGMYIREPLQADGFKGVFADMMVYKGHGLVTVYENTNAVLPYGIFFVEEDDETIETVLHRTEGYVDTNSAAVLSDDEAADYLALPIAGKIDNAISSVTDGNDNAVTVDVYTIEGVRVRANVAKAGALKGLKPGLYIVNKTKVLVK